MRIGIDLDNTIIDYDISFSAAARSLDFNLPDSVVSKYHVREHFRSQADGEQVWQKLQGLAYGKLVQTHARLYPGVKRFLWRCRQKGHHVQIISHKTEYGHFDIEKLPIREVAVSFLQSQEILGGKTPLVEKITFESTREEKVARIIDQHFDWFIDDLTEVIDDLSSDATLHRVLFSPLGNQKAGVTIGQEPVKVFSDWQQIDAAINGEWSLIEIEQLTRQLLNEAALSIEKISNGGNAGVYKLLLVGNRSLKLKIYPVDAKHDRLHSEYLATTAISRLSESNISHPVTKDISLGIGIYEWVEGNRVNEHDLNDIQASLDFLCKLHAIKNDEQFSGAQLASAACLSGAQIEKQLHNRIEEFSYARTIYSELDLFLSKYFLPLMNELLLTASEKWPSGNGYDDTLPADELTLSPSDFGFHNTVRRENGKLAFLDFEYFGWDDPVKLISDFSFHPGMSLTDEEVTYWLQGAINIYGEHVAGRLHVCRPLYGLIWCLILLNDFRPEIWQRRILADKSKKALRKQTLNFQLEKARVLLTKIQLAYSCNLIIN